MSEAPPDLDALARRYLDLWQDHLAALAEDPELARQTERLLSLVAAALGAGMGPGMGKGPGQEGAHGARSRGEAAKRPAPGAAAAAVSSGAGELDLARLARRLGSIERRLAALDTATSRAKPKPKPRPKAKAKTSQRPRRRAR